TVFDARGVATAKSVGLPVQPRCPVLGAQLGQPVTKESRGQTLEPGHLGQWTKVRGKIGGVLRHADGLQGVRLWRLWCLDLLMSSSEMLTGHRFRRRIESRMRRFRRTFLSNKLIMMR